MKCTILKKFVYVIAFSIVFSACVSTDNIAGLTGVTSTPTSTPVPAGPSTKPLAFLRITNGSTLSPYPGTTLNIGNTIPLRAVLVGDGGTLIQDVNVAWSVNNSLATTDLTTPNSIGVQEVANFTASKISSGSVSATIINFSDPVFTTYNLVSTTTVTGPIAVTYTLAADTVSKDVSSGDGQSVQAGTIPPSDLRVKVVNAGGVSVPGVTVNFAPSAANNGSVVLCGSGTGDVVTNSSGIAACTVRLGGTLGVGNQVFTATIPTGSSRSTSFNLTATYGTPSKLKFTQDPQGPSKGTSISTLPILVEVEDQFGNRVLNATNSITLSKNSPAGGGVITGGVLTVSSSSGVASFTAIGYSIAELGVKFKAVSTGLTDALTASFDVSDVIQQGRCASEVSGFITAEGGCKDTSTGLIWSASSDTTPSRPAGFPATGLANWGQTIWDEAIYALNTSTPTETSLGTTTDRDLDSASSNPSTSNPDNNALAYCHSLVESGYDDWRTPSYGETGVVRADGAPTTLKDISNKTYWTSSSCGTNGVTDRLDTPAGNCSQNPYAFYVRCVRQSPPVKLVIVNPSSPLRGVGQAAPFENGPIVKVAETNGVVVKRAGVLVRLTAYRSTDNTAVQLVSSGGQLVNYVQASTDSTGAVTFPNIGVAANGSIYFKANGMNVVGSIDYTLLTTGVSAPISINQNYPWALCKTEDANWKNSAGGCKDMGTGTIWSSTSLNMMGWDDAVWDYASTVSSPPRPSDNSRQNDYNPSQTVVQADQSVRNYCHDLGESGQTDWKMPLYSEAQLAGTHGAINYLRPFNDWQWVADEVTAANANVYYLQGNYGSNDQKIRAYHTMCVRRDPPIQIIASVSAPDQTPNYAIGGVFSLNIFMRDADGAPSNASGSVTINLIGGTGILSEGGVSRGTSFTKSVSGGRVILSLSYNKAESVSFNVTGSATFSSATLTLTPAATGSLNFTPSAANLCNSGAPAGWANDVLGGCKDTVNGKTWSATQPGTFNWYDTGFMQGVCTGLRIGGYSDWHLPTEVEWNGSIPRTVNTALQSWSVASYYGVDGNQRAVYAAGPAVVNFTGSGVSVRCVR